MAGETIEDECVPFGRYSQSKGYPPVPVLMGPTGSGKTAAALALAREFPLVAICADLRQAMRGMTIGSAQPSPAELVILPHRLCGVLDPSIDITVEDWRKLADSEIMGVISAGKIPLVLGGSGLAVKALMDGGEFDAPPAPVLRAKLAKLLDEIGLAKLLEMTGRFVEGILLESERSNPHRVVRAIERYAWNVRENGAPDVADMDLKAAWISQIEDWKSVQSNKTENEFAVATESDNPPGSLAADKNVFEYKIFALYPDRKWLAGRILMRARDMFQNGLLDEVKAMLDSGVTQNARALKGHGYPEAIAVLEGVMSVEEAIVKTAAVTRKYAKRQITWLKHQFEDVTFLQVGDEISPEDAVKPIAEFLAKNWAAKPKGNRSGEYE